MTTVAREPSYPDGWMHDHMCVGCGPSNDRGLRLTPEIADDGTVTATFTADDEHAGPPGRVHGGFLAVPADCVASWAAMSAVRRRAAADGRDPTPVVALTGGYEVRLLAATPTHVPVRLRAVPGELDGRRLVVRVDVTVDGTATATFEGVFVEVDLARSGGPR